jgi:hypothetical protein
MCRAWAAVPEANDPARCRSTRCTRRTIDLFCDSMSIRHVEDPRLSRLQRQSLAIHVELDIRVCHDRNVQPYETHWRSAGDIAVLMNEASRSQRLQAGIQDSRWQRSDCAFQDGAGAQYRVPEFVLEQEDLRPVMPVLHSPLLSRVLEAPRVGLQEFRVEPQTHSIGSHLVAADKWKSVSAGLRPSHQSRSAGMSRLPGPSSRNCSETSNAPGNRRSRDIGGKMLHL